MNGIDSPEIKGKTANEKELAKKSRDALSTTIMGKIVTLKNVSTEKYGRILADVYLGDLCINEWMLTNNYAVKYDGGTKERPDEWN
jgi:endonuclease YncB( thermonuclease family)